ncbi:MAG: MoaD/ThiS family protein [Wenzhouxiangellaceae bacterium]|nr:MoaD/ThiS family protein [Wenzhouxiangellaceae bacterium]
MSTAEIATETLDIGLFGGFRQFVPEGRIEIDANGLTTITDLRARVEQAFADNPNALMLLKASAFATDRRVLDDESEALPRGEALSVLPPVCGG